MPSPLTLRFFPQENKHCLYNGFKAATHHRYVRNKPFQAHVAFPLSAWVLHMQPQCFKITNHFVLRFGLKHGSVFRNSVIKEFLFHNKNKHRSNFSLVWNLTLPVVHMNFAM